MVCGANHSPSGVWSLTGQRETPAPCGVTHKTQDAQLNLNV